MPVSEWAEYGRGPVGPVFNRRQLYGADRREQTL